jgi:hypothetical protein
LHDLFADRYVTEKPTGNELERFGLDAPPVKVTLSLTKPDKKTEEHAFLFGKETDDKTGIYAKQSDRDMVFVVRKTLLDTFQGELQDPMVVQFDMSKLKGAKLVGWQDIIGSPFALELERKGNAEWTVKSPADYKLDAVKMEAFISGLSGLRAERFLGPKNGGQPEYKLDLPGGALEVSLLLEGEKDPFRLIIGAGSNEGYYGMTSKLGNEVILLPKNNFADVKSRPAYFKKQ